MAFIRPNYLHLKIPNGPQEFWPKTPQVDSLPSQILPYLYVGNLDQTNVETLNRLHISHILSLGLLPLISSCTPLSPANNNRILLPSRNSSIDFKISVKSPPDENEEVKSRPIQCRCINIADNSDQILSQLFDDAHQFIDEAKRIKGNVLVHCLAGISRSPSIAIAYLMRVKSLKFEDAYNLVKQRRPQIEPNFSFIHQLMIYEKSLNDKKNLSDVRNK